MGLLNASIKGHAKTKWLKMTDPSTARRTACVNTGSHFDSACERVIDHFNITFGAICCKTLQISHKLTLKTAMID